VRAAASTEKRIPGLDGIRGVAISLVLIYHSFFVFADFPMGSAPARLLAFTRLWWNGVDLFFVLSGFLIGGILLDAKNSPTYYRTFYSRRAFRILPLYLALLTAYSLAAPFIPSYGDPLPGWSYLPMLQNFFIAATGAFGVAWLGVTWSLAVEEQFYLVAPALVRHLNRRSLAKVVLVTIAGAPLVRIALFFLLPQGQIAAFVLAISRTDVLMVGVAVALVMRERELVLKLRSKRKVSIAITAILGCVVLLFTVRNWSLWTIQMIAVGYTVQAIFFGLVVLLIVLDRESLIARVLSVRPLRFLGVRAYAIYLFHVPAIYGAFLIAGYESPRVSSGKDAVVVLLALCATIALAAASWVWFERPLIELGHRFSYRPSEITTLTTGKLFSKIPAALPRVDRPESALQNEASSADL
jgi:peptidoglycan/LPS O-acetylase OafA/YrhL